VPLGSGRGQYEDVERAEEYELDEDGRKYRRGKGKGKERARDDDERDGQNVFSLGDEDEDGK
jgi:hypothetical protein